MPLPVVLFRDVPGLHKQQHPLPQHPSRRVNVLGQRYEPLSALSLGALIGELPLPGLHGQGDSHQPELNVLVVLVAVEIEGSLLQHQGEAGIRGELPVAGFEHGLSGLPVDNSPDAGNGV